LAKDFSDARFHHIGLRVNFRCRPESRASAADARTDPPYDSGMTQMLASVVNAAEARVALDGGADILDFSDASGGALGVVAIETIADAARSAGKARAISAALGNPPYDGERLSAQAHALSAAGVGAIRLAANADTLDRLDAALSGLAKQIPLVGVLFADRDPDFGALDRLAALGFRAALLDAAEKGGKRLLDHLPPHRIEAFCRRCRELELGAWLAGALQGPDVPRLLLLDPDILGFRSALCLRGRRAGPLDPHRVALIRDLIPHEDTKERGAGFLSPIGRGAGLRGSGESERTLSGPRASPGDAATTGSASDTIFVHDFLTTAEIGAYAHERGVRQRLLFNIDAAVARIAAHADDMRAVVSYDVILDAVRIVVGRGHVDFIETVAEEVAAIVLKHPRVRQVRVRVEKLDVVAGSVGVEIVRGR